MLGAIGTFVVGAAVFVAVLITLIGFACYGAAVFVTGGQDRGERRRRYREMEDWEKELERAREDLRRERERDND